MKNNHTQNCQGSGCWLQRIVRHLVSILPTASSGTNATLSPEHILVPLKSLNQELFCSEVRRRRLLLLRSQAELKSKAAKAVARGEDLQMFLQAEYTKRHNRFLSWMGRVCPSVGATYSSRYEAARHTDATTHQILCHSYMMPNESSSPTAGGGGGGAQPKGTNEK